MEDLIQVSPFNVRERFSSVNLQIWKDDWRMITEAEGGSTNLSKIRYKTNIDMTEL